MCEMTRFASRICLTPSWRMLPERQSQPCLRILAVVQQLERLALGFLHGRTR